MREGRHLPTSRVRTLVSESVDPGEPEKTKNQRISRVIPWTWVRKLIIEIKYPLLVACSPKSTATNVEKRGYLPTIVTIEGKRHI